MATLPDDYWHFDEASQSLSGRRTRKMFQLAQLVEVRLAEAKPVTGGLLFHVLGGGEDGRVSPTRFAPKRGDKKPGKKNFGQKTREKRRR